MPKSRDGQSLEPPLLLEAAQVRFLLAEVSRWQEEGLIDGGTGEKLRLRYRHAVVPRAVPALAPEPSPGALARELAEAAERELERDAELTAEPPLEEALAEEVEHVTAVEEIVVRARGERAAELNAVAEKPVEERAAGLAPALVAAARDLVSLPGVEESPAPPEARVLEAEVAREPRGFRNRLRPFLYENALWLAGGLLVVFGSLYFLRLSWEQLSSLGQRLIVAGSLHLYAGAFFGVGYALARRRGAFAVGRILHAFALAILPLGSLALGELCAALLGARGWGGPLAVVAALLGFGVQGVFLFLIGGLENRACARGLVGAGLALSALAAAVATFERIASGSPLPLLALPLGFLALAWGLMRLAGAGVVVRESVLLVGGALVGLALVLFRLALPAGHLVVPLSIAAFGLALLSRRGAGGLGWPLALAGLAADITLNMVRYGLSSPALGALFLTLLGLLVVAAMVIFSLERERILRRYSLVLGELRTWD